MSAIMPNKAQFAELAQAAESNNESVVMLNLLKFKSGGGAREYDAYFGAASKMVDALGGRLLYVGRVDQALVGDLDANDSDAIALVEYPSRKAFIEMVSRKDWTRTNTARRD